MTTFHEHDHPRSRGGKFTTKEAAEAEGVTLTCDPEPVDAPEVLDRLWCDSCQVAFEESEAARLYECGECGAKSSERRCENCNKFMARCEEPGCPNCEEPVAEDTVEVVADHDGTLILAEDYDPDTAKSERDALARAEREAQEAADRATRLAERQQAASEQAASAIEPGTVLMDPNDASKWMPSRAEVISTRTVQTPDGPRVLIRAVDHGVRTLVRRPEDVLDVDTRDVPSPSQERGNEPVHADDFDGARLLDGFRPDLGPVSSPHSAIDVCLGPSNRDGGTIPVLALMAGRRGRDGGSVSGSVTYLGRWDDPETAAKALDEWDRAADALANARVEHPPTYDEDDYRRDDENADPTAQFREQNWVSADPMHTVDLEIGISAWEESRGAMLKIGNERMNSALVSPAVIKSAVAEARKHLHRLTGIPVIPDVVDDKF